MGVDGREKSVSLSSRKPEWEKDPDLRSDVSPETQLEQKQLLERLPVLLDAVMKILPEHERQALRQTFYKDRTFQRNQRTFSLGKETAQQITKRVLPIIQRREIQASIRQLLGGPKEIRIPERIKINIEDRISGKIASAEVTKRIFEEEVMRIFDERFFTPTGIAEALGCEQSYVYLVIISKLYERELVAGNGTAKTQTLQ